MVIGHDKEGDMKLLSEMHRRRGEGKYEEVSYCVSSSGSSKDRTGASRPTNFSSHFRRTISGVNPTPKDGTEVYMSCVEHANFHWTGVLTSLKFGSRQLKMVFFW